MVLSKIYRSNIHNPICNLAFEEALFRGLSSQERVLLLWVNEPSIIIGRNQNPWLESHVDHAVADGVPIIRRLSGGGTVFHDLGNINFSFITWDKDYDTNRHFQMIIKALKAFGIDLVLNERSDLLFQERKVSGNAFYFRGQRRLHHGTLLIQSDEARLWRYLLPEDLPIQGKGIASKRHPVLNLSDYAQALTTDAAIKAIAAVFKRTYPNASLNVGSPEQLLHQDRLAIYKEAKEKYGSWSWNFGETPKFTYDIDTSSRIEIEGGYVMGTTEDRSHIKLSGIRFKEDPIC